MSKKVRILCVLMIIITSLNGCGRINSINVNSEPYSTITDNKGVNNTNNTNASNNISTEEKTKIIKIAAGDEHNLILKSDGTVLSFGSNEYGQLGVGTTENKNLPVQVKGLTNVIDISAGICHSLALKKDGTVWSWGSNFSGQLGDGTNQDRLLPIQVKGLTDVIAISAGGDESMALKEDGTVWAWGDNQDYKLGSAREDWENVGQVPDIDNVISIAAGGLANLALKSDGTVWAWGNNRDIYLCIGSDILYFGKPEKVIGISDVKSISASPGGILALKNDNSVWKWGESEKPEIIKELNNITFIAQGGYHGLAVTNGRNLWAWGDNRSGQIGNGKTEIEDVDPSKVQDISDIISVAGGSGHTIALTSSGDVYTWGSNQKGQLGDGKRVDRYFPSKILIK